MAEEKKTLIGKVAKVIDERKLVITIGSQDGIKTGYKFLVYEIGEEILDPDTNKSLGKLEIVKGTGKVTHIQDEIATLETAIFEEQGVRKIIRQPNSIFGILGGATEEISDAKKQPVPFENPQIGDFVKYIP